MTKRTLNSDNKSNNKKPKLNDDIDALWGDDELDESVFDDCIKLATQVLGKDQNKGNESILPHYDVFKAPNSMFSSTQFDENIRPTTSNNANFPFYKPVHSLDTDIQKLRVQCEEKDGEVAILRNQLRDVRTQSNIEYQKSHSEWKTKLSLSEKQVQSAKSELEFKNLEIANLKQKVLSLTRHSMNTTLTNDVTRSPKPSVSKAKPADKNTSTKLYSTVIVDYPLKNVLADSFITISHSEKFIIDNKLAHTFKNGIPYLQNKTLSTRVILNKNRADVQSIYPIILKLSECTSTELDSVHNIVNVNKIIDIGLQSLQDLLDLLQEIKNNLRTEDILEADSLYLKNVGSNTDSEGNFDNDLGRSAAFIIKYLSVLLPYNTYLKDYFIHNKPLNVREEQADVTKISKKIINNGHYFLNKLVTILNVAGELRKSNVMSLFLNSTIKLFTNICKIDGYTFMPEIVCKFAKELIFCRPHLSVIFEFTYFLKEASRYTGFVQFLLNKSKNCCSTKKGIIYFNEDACRFYVFALLFDKSLNKNKNISLKICLNMLCFIYNTYKSSYFLHHQDIKECECLPQLYKLEIELIFRMLEKYSEEALKKTKTSDWATFFDNKIILKVLNLMAFHCFELTEKYITVYSQFKEIERRLNENGVCDLGRLNINEDIPEIDSKNFENIGF